MEAQETGNLFVTDEGLGLARHAVRRCGLPVASSSGLGQSKGQPIWMMSFMMPDVRPWLRFTKMFGIFACNHWAVYSGEGPADDPARLQQTSDIVIVSYWPW